MSPFQFSLFEEPPAVMKTQFVWDFGENCPIPGYFPSGGGDPQRAQDQLAMIARKDWKALQYAKIKWWCHFCNSWHHYDKFFFDTFDGVYPHEMRGEEWQKRLGGWEAELRRDFNLVGKPTREVLREVTHAVYYAYWAEREVIGQRYFGQGDGAGRAVDSPDSA